MITAKQAQEIRYEYLLKKIKEAAEYGAGDIRFDDALDEATVTKLKSLGFKVYQPTEPKMFKNGRYGGISW